MSELNQKLIQIRSDEMGQEELLEQRKKELQEVSEELKAKLSERAEIEQKIQAAAAADHIGTKASGSGTERISQRSIQIGITCRTWQSAMTVMANSIRRVMERKGQEAGHLRCGCRSDPDG